MKKRKEKIINYCEKPMTHAHEIIATTVNVIMLFISYLDDWDLHFAHVLHVQFHLIQS